MGALGRSQVSGTFQIRSSSPYTPVVRVPAAALEPGQVTVKNAHATAVIYGKWIPLNQTNPSVSTTDAGVRLEPFESYTWDDPPANAMLLLLTTVDLSTVNVEAVWAMPEDAQLL